MKATLLSALLFAAATAAQTTYTITEHGTPCGADLAAQLVTTPNGPALRLGMQSNLPNSLAVLAIGTHRLVPAVQLPGPTPCELVVMPRATMLDTTNGNGNVMFGFRIPPVVPIRVLFQGVVLHRTPQGLAAASSDVVELVGQ